MFSKSFEKRESEKIPEKMEISLGSAADLGRLEKWLENFMGAEEAGQCVFVLRSMAKEDFINHCKDAVWEFGRRLSKRFGDEESFFELAPSAGYYDARSEDPLLSIGYRLGGFHSVGVIQFEKEKKDFSLIFDLTYGDISGAGKRDAVFALCFPGGREDVMKKLGNHYGGSWQAEYELDTKNGKFRYLENQDG